MLACFATAPGVGAPPRRCLPARHIATCQAEPVDGSRGGDAPHRARLSRRCVVHGLAAVWLSRLTPRADAAARTLEYPELRGLDDGADASGPAPFRAQNGVQVQEISMGTGPPVEAGRSVSVKYVLRRSNGYFVDASYGFDRFDNYVFRAGSGAVIEGFERGVAGMREGGRRRFVVPPALGYGEKVDGKGPGPVPPGFGPRRALAAHVKEPLVFEVLVVRVRE